MQEQVTQEPGAVRPGGFNTNHFDANKDKPRNRSRILMRVHNRNTLALDVKTNTITPGEHTVEVYDDDERDVLAMVEDPVLVAQAHKQYERDIAEEVGKNLQQPWMGTVEELQAMIASGANEEIAETYRRVLKTTGLSPEGAFQRLNKRSMRPLVSAEKVQNSEKPEPQRAATQKEVQKQADAIAEALDRVLAKHIGGAALTADQIRAVVSEQVQAELGSKPAKR